MTSRSSAGGAATSGGVDYQGLVGAYAAVRILAESALSPLWDLPEDVTFTGLWAESGAAVDDVLVTTSARGYVFVQAKRTAGMSHRVGTTIGAAFAQFVAQYRVAGSKPFPITNEKRALDPQRDRIVLATSATTGPLDDFASVLRRLRDMGSVARPRDCAKTDADRDALARGIRLVRGCWQQFDGSSPSWAEMVPFLHMVRITTLRLEDDEPEEQTAKYWLRDRILVRANEAELAWKLLKDTAIGLAKRKSGVERPGVQKALTDAGMPLRALRSYEADIDRLRAHTTANLRSLLRFSRIRYDGVEVTIRRAYETVLKDEASAESLVVIGDAGCGKSGLLAVFADQARASGSHVVVLNAGELGAESLGQMRDELNLDCELVEVLENWHGDGPAFLVIDALDSARDDRTAAALRLLIQRVQDLAGRWRVVATIRKFDLKNGKHWQQVMPGKGIRPYFDPVFDNVRHLNVGVLSSTDIDGLKESAPELYAMVHGAPAAVADLLHVPFNLMLANELRIAGGATDLKTITTQLGLLDKYWDRRVDGSLVEGGQQEKLLREVTDAMLSARRLHLPLPSVLHTPALETLLSRSVLVNHSARLQYSHHILFDYAVERLLLRPNSDTAIASLAADRDLPIAAGPSVKYWLEGTWERDSTRVTFWALALRLVLSDAPAIAKIVAGTVAAEKTSVPTDCDGLIASVSSDGGAKIFMFVADALTANLAGAGSQRPSPWFVVLEQSARLATPFVFHRGTVLLHSLLDIIKEATPEEMTAAGRFARSALDQAWSMRARNGSFITAALRAVGRTFRSDAASSETLLRRALDAEHVKAHGHEELRWLADYAAEFVDAPQFLADLYETTFAAQASADERTVIWNSQIFGLASNKKQDLDGARWQLGRRFEKIVRDDVALAATITVRLINQYVAQGSTPRGSVEFTILGETAQFQAEGYVRHRGAKDEEPEILEQLVQRLCAIADDAAHSATVTELIRIVARTNRTQMFWRALANGAANSRGLFVILREMLFAPEVLSRFSQQFVASLRTHRALLSSADLARAQDAAVTLRDGGYGDVTAFRLLNALGVETLSSEARIWFEKISLERDQVAENGPMQPDEGDDDEDERADDSSTLYVLRQRGMTAEDLNNDVNRTVRARTKELLLKLNDLPKDADKTRLTAIETDMRSLERSLDSEGVHNAQASISWGAVAEAASALAQHGVDSVADVIVVASQRPEPKFVEQEEEQFARGASWSSGQARMEAVPGVMALVARTDNPAVLAAVERLANDAVSSVRFEVGRHLPEIAARHSEFYWTLLERLSRDANPTVVAGLHLRHALSLDARRSLDILVRAFRAWQPHVKEHESLIEKLFSMILLHSLTTGAPTANEIVDEVTNDPVGNAGLLGHAALYLRDAMTAPREPAQDNPSAHNLRKASIAYITRVTESALVAFRTLENKTQPTANDREQFEHVATLLSDVAQELYFGSLAYDDEHEADKGKPDPKVRVRFFEESKQLLRELSTVGLAASAHYLIQTLASFVDLVEPATLFLLIADTVRAGRKGGYQYESLAVKEIVAIVERYLADFRVIFVENADCRAGLRDILDTFVEAGWSETHRLVYSLDSIFR